MKGIFTLLGLGTFFFLCLVKSYGQQVTIDAEIRPRMEFRQGFNQPLADTLKASGLTLQRTRLNFNYTSSLLNARITLQDSRVFGETDTKQPSSATGGSLGIYEAWAEMLLLPGTSFKLGRQGVQFEDGRLFSLSPWSNTGNAHDMGQLLFNSPGFHAQLGFAYSNQKAYNADSVYYNVSKMYKQLAFFHLTKTLVPGLDLSLLAVDEGFEKSKTNLNLYHRYTTGGTLLLKKEKLPLGFLLTAYHQSGKSSSTVDLNANLFAIKATYLLSDKTGVTAGTDYYSGSSTTLDASQTNTFNKLPYGVNHSFNGYMEYWGSLPKGGLINYFGGLNLKPGKKLGIDLTYYAFRLAKDMTVSNTAVQKNIGSELDLVLNYKMTAGTAVQFGWCSYFVTDGTRLLKLKSTEIDTKFPQYAYLMLTIKPKFYTQK